MPSIILALAFLFQSTPPRGRRPHLSDYQCAGDMFQSTPPRGRRRRSPRSPPSPWQFQSTPPRGRRRSDWGGCGPHQLVSIHASAREATCNALLFRCMMLMFQSTPPRGRRPRMAAGPDQFLRRFNPRLRAGGDSQGRFPPSPRFCFNPRLRAGGDPPARALWWCPW